MRSLAIPGAIEELVSRVQTIQPEAKRHWGLMTAHEMLCHLADSFRIVLGERPVVMVPANRVTRHLMRLVALHVPLRWPRGIRTVPEVDPKRDGTRPSAFEADRQAVLTLLQRFAANDARYARHPMFGAMSRHDWMIWGYRHMDHHLRQFGV
jgi:hypothetical protein